MMSIENIHKISEVVEYNLCNTCGACYAVCQSEAISFTEQQGGCLFPFVDSEKCSKCGLCLKVCPGIKLSKELIKRIPADPFAGESLCASAGKAVEREIYENSQSGGIVSSLVIHALKAGFADAATVVSMDWGKPPRPKAYLARKEDEVFLSQKSKYCPVPLLSVLKEVTDSNERIVFVGTSCQVHGLYGILEVMPELKKRVVLILGLFCDRVMTCQVIDYLIYKSKMSRKISQLLLFRDKSCGGYPGNVHIKSEDGGSSVLPSGLRMSLKDYFTPLRCRLCFDKMNVFSDISAGDVWGIDSIDRSNGETAVVIRNRRGMDFFQAALDNKIITVREIEYNDIVKGQDIYNKRRDWIGYTLAWKKLGGVVPDYGFEISKDSDSNPEKYYIKKLKYSKDVPGVVSNRKFFKLVDRFLMKKTISDLFFKPLKVIKSLLR